MQVVEHLTRAALAAAQDDTSTALERAQMLMELAMGLQRRPKTPEHLEAAIKLYEEALALCPAEDRLLAARITARQATALQAVPNQGRVPIEQARAAFEQAIPVLAELGRAEERAEAELNLGLCLQHLAGSGHARITDAIAAYQRALATFDVKRFPVEFAILQNNLATAFLSMPVSDERGKIREALAVQCFEEGLKVVDLVHHPSEYAMLQNNLGNALQYASSSHAAENNARALIAYDEALKVRSRTATPLEYANTISNKANCLWNLGHLEEAKRLYQEAHEIFAGAGDGEKARMVAEALTRIAGDLLAAGS